MDEIEQYYDGQQQQLQMEHQRRQQQERQRKCLVVKVINVLLVIVIGVVLFAFLIGFLFFDVNIILLPLPGERNNGNGNIYDPPESYRYDPPPPNYYSSPTTTGDGEEEVGNELYPTGTPLLYIRSGPLIGHTTDTTTTIWILQGQGKTLYLKYWEKKTIEPLPANLMDDEDHNTTSSSSSGSGSSSSSSNQNNVITNTKNIDSSSTTLISVVDAPTNIINGTTLDDTDNATNDGNYHIIRIENTTTTAPVIQVVPMPPNMVGGSSIVIITGLKSLTIYEYQILYYLNENGNEEEKEKTIDIDNIGNIKNKNDEDFVVVAESQFRTAPPSTTTAGTAGAVESSMEETAHGKKFRYLLASCMNVRTYPNQIVWKHILELQNQENQQEDEGDDEDQDDQQQHLPISFALLPGDTIYLNYDDWNYRQNEINFRRYIIRNIEQRDEINFASLIKQIPTYTIWDDHDYGSNNSNKYQNGKEYSLQGFLSMWGNPNYNKNKNNKKLKFDRNDNEGDTTDDDSVDNNFDGNYYTYYWGSDVQYIVVDCRWYRDESNGIQFGTKQMEWLYTQLLHSTAIFKIIVTGVDVMERNMNNEIKNLLGNFVTKHSITGILFHSGDIHRNELKIQIHDDTWPYPIIQITSSGIGMVWRRPFAIIDIDTTDTTTTSTSTGGVDVKEPTITVRFYGAKDDSIFDTEWINDPNLQCTSIVGKDRGKEHICTETITLSQLSP